MPRFRVRRNGSAWVQVDVTAMATEQGIKEAVAAAVSLPVGTFGLKQGARVTTFHSRLEGNWDVVLLPPSAGNPVAPLSRGQSTGS